MCYKHGVLIGGFVTASFSCKKEKTQQVRVSLKIADAIKACVNPALCVSRLCCGTWEREGDRENTHT